MRSVNEFRPGNIRMMIVDDDSDLRMILDDYFEKRGFNVVSLRSGAAAVDVLSSGREQFDIVLTDLVMPGVDGMDVLRAARGHNPLVHVVVMTGYSSLKTAIESIRCGAFDYLAKPFELMEIEITVWSCWLTFAGPSQTCQSFCCPRTARCRPLSRPYETVQPIFS